VKPTPELPLRVALVGNGLLRESLDVVDVSVSGLAVTSPALRDLATGHQMKLTLAFGSAPEHTVTVVLRWVRLEVAGVEIVEPSPAVTAAVNGYIAELLERGATP